MNSVQGKVQLEDVSKLIKLAKLDENELEPITQCLFYADSSVEFDKLKFIELDNYLFEELTEGNILFLKGEHKENTVLCTKNRTYELKEAETSNSKLLTPELKFLDEVNKSNENKTERSIENKIVSGIFYNYLEVKHCNPRLEKLIRILNQTAFKGPENEYSIENSKLVSFDNLLQKIQASEEELKCALNSLKSFEINGHIRVLEFNYQFRVLSFMLDLIEENSWKLDEVCKENTVDSLKEIFPSDIINKLFDFYTKPSKIKDDKQFYTYIEHDVCRFLAEALLRNTNKLILSDFNQAWKESVPEGMIVSEEMLDGMAIIEKNVNPNVIWLYKEENLPENNAERFRILFNVKEYWTKEQITPYIRAMTSDKVDVNMLLMKYARTSNNNGIRYYSAKHGK